MKFGAWQWFQRLLGMLASAHREPSEQAQRVVTLQRNVILPARLIIATGVLYQLYNTPWLNDIVNTYGVIFETIQQVFASYALLVLAVTVLFYVVRKFPPGAVQWFTFITGLADGIFLAGLTLLTGGFESPLYWVYPGIIILNALSIPLATPQIVLNLTLSILFLGAGILELNTQTEASLPGFRPRPTLAPPGKFLAADFEKDLPHLANWLQQAPPQAVKKWPGLFEHTLPLASNYVATGTNAAQLQSAIAEEFNRLSSRPARVFSDANLDLPEGSPGPHILRVAVLVLLTFCCYGLQALVASQQRNEEEQKEFLVRTEQLRGAGRLAAEFAHQIKNPLAIINNAVFSLQRALKNSRPEATQPLQIIEEEVTRADQIITQIMGYAQLSEGRVEKLDVLHELNRAIEQVFPAGINSGIQLHRDFASEFPPLLMQRRHLSECLMNLLQNARDALHDKGNIYISAKVLRDYSVEFCVKDDGPGIPEDKVERIFEAYYTTKEKGTGLGLAIVKHNAELYAGSIRVESKLGQGAKFVLVFPAKTLIKISK